MASDVRAVVGCPDERGFDVSDSNQIKGGSVPLTDEQLLLLEDAPDGALACVEIRSLREELATPPDERSELHWDRGYRAALTGMLVKVLSDLGYQDTEATRAKWVVEREHVIRALRIVCRDLGDNDWPATGLSLADVIEKHLHRHFDAGRIVGTIQRLLKSLPSDDARAEAISEVCAVCGRCDHERCTGDE